MVKEAGMERFYDVVKEISLGEIEEITGARLLDPAKRNFKVSNLASLESMDGNSVIYVAMDANVSKLLDKSAKYKKMLERASAGAAFITGENAGLLPESVVALATPDPKLAFIMLAEHMYRDKALARRGISPHACIHDSVKFKDRSSVHVGEFAVIEEGVEIGEGCYIGAGAKIKAGVSMGKDCIIRENAVVSHAILGNGVRIGEGTVIGGNGFGWHSGARGHVWVPQMGRVVLKDNVDVGCNACLDRGAIDDTVIGQGTKIDNLVQIGHNVRIGENCILAGLSGVAGSTIMGDWVLVGAQAGISGHLNIGSGSQIGAGAGVIQDLPPNSGVSGYPALPMRDFLKQSAMLRRMMKKKKD
jgi:UDP-3-O-[3-hydroxymyristoyl] glucosamine N-acyltransferase